ncbi:hypothetical protein FF38_03804, partial [Lucilia cuprina]
FVKNKKTNAKTPLNDKNKTSKLSKRKENNLCKVTSHHLSAKPKEPVSASVTAAATNEMQQILNPQE